MIEKREFYFQSYNQTSRIHCQEWIPEGEIIGIFQLVHGMTEYIDRYDDFARFLAGKGFYVVGHDHQGHGKSVKTVSEWGYFDKKNPSWSVLADIEILENLTKKKYPSIPYFLLGHSMGSFFVRRFTCLYGERFQGVIVMGTGNQPAPLIKVGKFLNFVNSAVFGQTHRSPFLANMMFGENNKQIHNPNTPYDWLTKDEKIVTKYSQDPACTFLFTGNGIKGLLDTVDYVTKQKHVNLTPTDLPVLFLSGEDDPVGEYGKAVKKAFQLYENHKMKSIRLKLYKTDRHEILNELDRETVYMDIYQWAQEILGQLGR